MAIKHGSKVMSAGSAASMTDLMFLLLVFLLIATTLINPNALKLLLPKSENQMTEKPYTTISITPDLRFYVELEEVPFNQLEQKLREKVGNAEDPIVSLHADETVPWKDVVSVMDIVRRNNYTLIAATRAR